MLVIQLVVYYVLQPQAISARLVTFNFYTIWCPERLCSSYCLGSSPQS